MDDNYKQLDNESFLLVVMTKFKAYMFEKFSCKIVCVDSTHKTNPYRFKLVTVVVPDEFKRYIHLYVYITNINYLGPYIQVLELHWLLWTKKILLVTKHSSVP